MLRDGKYSVIFTATGEYRSIMVKTIRGDLGTKDVALMGKTILFYRKEGRGWQSFGFLRPDNSVAFFRKFSMQCSPAQLQAARKLIGVIAANPEGARRAFERLEPPEPKQKRLRLSRRGSVG